MRVRERGIVAGLAGRELNGLFILNLRVALQIEAFEANPQLEIVDIKKPNPRTATIYIATTK